MCAPLLWIVVRFNAFSKPRAISRVQSVDPLFTRMTSKEVRGKVCWVSAFKDRAITSSSFRAGIITDTSNFLTSSVMLAAENLVETNALADYGALHPVDSSRFNG